ncbi:hypothetical protein Tsubulata_033895 [Turnera subulata]|uniref:Uncharacterized protein n=1 Tax=Turnera subulata TaxID=218843 RepID=A0A9Q0FZ43_9ROSI|nr:hypothetical protein Tsubulata_033895 [Turnera subulata]
MNNLSFSCSSWVQDAQSTIKRKAIGGRLKGLQALVVEYERRLLPSRRCDFVLELILELRISDMSSGSDAWECFAFGVRSASSGNYIPFQSREPEFEAQNRKSFKLVSIYELLDLGIAGSFGLEHVSNSTARNAEPKIACDLQDDNFLYQPKCWILP